MSNFYSQTYKICLLLSVYFLSIESGNCQFKDSIKIMDPVFISATRYEKEPSETGRSISVITNAEIEKSVYTNVAELLSRQEGIYIVGTGQNPGNTQSVFTRGSNSNQTVIMIDGVRIADPSAVNNALDLSELSLANVDRIEIVRGSHSTIYGTGAVGGVINIITKKNGMAGAHGFAEVKSGTFSKGAFLTQENIFFNYNFGKGFYLDASAIKLDVKGQDATVDTVTVPGTFNKRDKDNFSKGDYVGKFGFRNNKLDIFASYKYNDQKSDLDNGAYSDDGNYKLKFYRSLINYGAAYKLNSRFNISFNGGLSYMTRKTVNDSSIIDNAGNNDRTYSDATYKGQTLVDEILLKYNFFGISGIAGLGHYDDRMSQRSYYYSNGMWGPYTSTSDLDTLDLHSSIKHAFAHADFNGKIISEKISAFSLGLGSRISNHNLFGNFLTYEINPSFKLDSSSLLYFSYSTGFNAPSLYQLYSPLKGYGAYTTLGNTKLKPETSASFELGLKFALHKNTTFTVAYFETVIKNSIEFVYLWDKNTPISSLSYLDDRGYTYLNLGTQRNKGIELSFQSMLTGKVKFFGNASIINGNLEYNPSEIDTNQTGGNHVQLNSNGAFVNTKVESQGLVRRPSNLINLGLTWFVSQKVGLTITSRTVGGRSDVFYDSQLGPYGALGTTNVSEYTLVDIMADYIVNKKVSINARIENAFNKNYMEIKGYTTRGRGLYMKLRYSF